MHFGIPQNRKRIFEIFIDQQSCEESKKLQVFKKFRELEVNVKKESPPKLRKFLELNLKSRRYLPDIREKDLITRWKNFYTWKDKKGNENSSYNRAWKIEKYCGALNCTTNIKISDGKRVWLLTAQEYALLMGFRKEDYMIMDKFPLSENRIKSFFGDSIVIPILKEILKIVLEVFKA